MSCSIIGAYWFIAGIVVGMVVGTLLKGDDD